MAKKPKVKLKPFPRRQRRGQREIGYAGLWDKGQQSMYARAAQENWNGINRLGAITAIREIAAKSTLAQAYIQLHRLHVVGHGAPVPTFSKVKSAKDRAKLAKLWAMWAFDCSVNGGENMGGVLRALVASLVVDGRVFAVLRRHSDYPCGLALMPLERDWLADDGHDHKMKLHIGGRDYEAVNGVVRAESGRVSHYIFYGKPTPADVVEQRRAGYAAQQLFVQAHKKYSHHAVPVDMVLDLYCARNAADYEGQVSHLLPALRKMQEIARLDNAMLQSMEISAKKMGFIERELNSQTLEEMEAAGQEVIPPPTEFEAATIEELPPGYKFNSFSPDAPNADISKYRLEIIQNAAASLGPDHASIAGDLRSVNYSSIRHGMSQAKEGYRVMQHEVERKVLRPVLSKLLETARMRGELDITAISYKEALASDWRHKVWPHIDPLNDLQAEVLAVQLGCQSPQRLAAAQGMDWEQLQLELDEAAKRAKKAGLTYLGAQPPAESGNSSNAPSTKQPPKTKPKDKEGK